MIRWDKRGTVRAGFIFYSMGKGIETSIETGVFVHHKIISAVRRVESVSDRMSHMFLGGRLCKIVV